MTTMVIDAITEFAPNALSPVCGKGYRRVAAGARVAALALCFGSKMGSMGCGFGTLSVFLPVYITFCPALKPIRLASTFGEPSTFVIVRSS